MLSAVLRKYARARPDATSRIILPVGVGRRSPGPTGVVGFTTTAPAPSASFSDSILLRLYATFSSQAGGESASVAGRPGTGPQVAALEVCTTRRSPAAAS